MGYIRMIRSGGLHCCSNAIRWVDWVPIPISHKKNLCWEEKEERETERERERYREQSLRVIVNGTVFQLLFFQNFQNSSYEEGGTNILVARA